MIEEKLILSFCKKLMILKLGSEISNSWGGGGGGGGIIWSFSQPRRKGVGIYLSNNTLLNVRGKVKVNMVLNVHRNHKAY